MVAVIAVALLAAACAPTPGPTDPGGSGGVTGSGEPSGSAAAPAPDPNAPPPDPADPAKLVCWGDSLSYAICDPGAGGALQAALSEREIVSRAISGQTSSEIALRMGAYPLTVTFPDDVLPASGRVDVRVEGAPSELRGFSTTARVGGVEGTLAFSGGFGGWSFERAQPGDEVPLAAGSPAHVLDADARAHPGFIWVGRNNVMAPEQTIADVAAMVAAHAAVSDEPMWVVGVTPARGETTGSSAAEAIAHVNDTLRATYGERYIAMDDHLRDDAMAAIGLSPTGADRDATASGVIPPSLMDPDGLHFNEHGNRAIAQLLAHVVRGG